jgi:hypothetical protein
LWKSRVVFWKRLRGFDRLWLCATADAAFRFNLFAWKDKKDFRYNPPAREQLFFNQLEALAFRSTWNLVNLIHF